MHCGRIGEELREKSGAILKIALIAQGHSNDVSARLTQWNGGDKNE